MKYDFVSTNLLDSIEFIHFLKHLSENEPNHSDFPIVVKLHHNLSIKAAIFTSLYLSRHLLR